MSQSSPFLRYQELQRYVGWTDGDADRVQALAPLVTPYFPGLIADFYAEVERHPEARRVFTGGMEQVHRLQTGLTNWLTELFSGQYDQKYVEGRWRIGFRHVEIGLNQVYVNMSLSRLRHRLHALIERQWQSSFGEMLAARTSLNTLMDLDLAILQDAYHTEYRRRQRGKERLAAIGKIAGGIAHELRNPLNVVKTSVYYLLHAQTASPDKIRGHLERIDRQVGVANDVITALGDFARLPLPHIDPVQVGDCLREALDLNPMPRTIAVECHVESPSLAVLGDRAQLQIVFGNLLRNARDAMPEGGSLQVAAVRDGSQIVISVQDTGTGIAEEDLSQVLEPLFSTKAKGIGLGLPITHDIVRRHQGLLTFSSQVGVGSTFIVRLNAFLGATEEN
jgi:signal transduction histidine kinase